MELRSGGRGSGGGEEVRSMDGTRGEAKMRKMEEEGVGMMRKIEEQGCGQTKTLSNRK